MMDWRAKRKRLGSLEEGYKMKSLTPRRCSSTVGWERRKEVTFIKQQIQTRCFIYSIKSQNQAVRLGLMVSS